MKILLDLQGLQSKSRDRGIGRLTRALALAMIEHGDGHAFHVLLSEDLDGTLDETWATFSAVLPPGHLHTVGPYGAVAEHAPASRWRTRAAALLREAKIAALRPDLVHVGSLFEGFADDAVLSVGRRAGGPPTAVTLYDLIPLADPDRYLSEPAYRDYYLRRALDLKRADLLLAISESSKAEASRLLQIPPERIAVMGAGVSDAFRPQALDDGAAAALRSRLGVPDAFILHVGATDPRKNIDALLEGFSRLPPTLREGRTLVFAGRLSAEEQATIMASAERRGIPAPAVVFTGFIEERDLVALYGFCEVTVLPSSHEGFGLPAAEAMACGAPVLAADRTSLPEVLGRTDCLFDPFDPAALADRLGRVLLDSAWRRELRDWGLVRSRCFTWAAAARRALDAFAAPPGRTRGAAGPASAGRKGTRTGSGLRPRMAFVSPLPPDESGIADYGAELVRELLAFYEIDCILPEGRTTDDWIAAACGVRTLAAFEERAGTYDRIVYSFGNSTFHAHMFGMLVRHPGTVILHDAFLSDVALQLSRQLSHPTRTLLAELYRSHGLTGLRRHQADGDAAVAQELTLAGAVFRNAKGVILHSRFGAHLAVAALGPEVLREIAVVPHLRALPGSDQRDAARRRLGFGQDDLVVCSFGIMHPRKMSGRTAEAFLQSDLAADPRCRLVYAGAEEPDLSAGIRAAAAGRPDCRAEIRFTGRIDAELYGLHLQAADIAVQLRTESRGETSGATLDAMAHGLATIVSDVGAFAEIGDNAVIKVARDVSAKTLAGWFDRLRAEPGLRAVLGARARDEIARQHHPATVAAEIRDAVERFAGGSVRSREEALLVEIAHVAAHLPPLSEDLDWLGLQTRTLFPAPRLRQILCDVSAIAETDLGTGIQRVVRSVLERLVAAPPAGFRIEPVIISGGAPVYARRFVEERLGLPTGGTGPDEVVFGAGDHYLCLDWIPDRLPAIDGWLARFRRGGGSVTTVVYDLLPLEQPDAFPDWLHETDRRWVDVFVRRSDQVACISAATAESVARFAGPALDARTEPLALGVFHLGHDLPASRPSLGLSPEGEAALAATAARPTFLMVGTVEPRKGHGQVVQGFEALWAAGLDVGLVIVGHEGWMVDALAARIRENAAFGTRLIWLRDASDAVLDRLYGAASALIAASTGEGFGLPLVEAAGHGLSVIARDLPVFREVGGDHATYFSGEAPVDLARAVEAWLGRHAAGEAPSSARMRRLTWAESTDELVAIMMGTRRHRVLAPAGRPAAASDSAAGRMAGAPA